MQKTLFTIFGSFCVDSSKKSNNSLNSCRSRTILVSNCQFSDTTYIVRLPFSMNLPWLVYQKSSDHVQEPCVPGCRRWYDCASSEDNGSWVTGDIVASGHSGHTAQHRPHVSNSLGSLDPQQDSNSAYKTFYMPTKGFCNVMELYKVLTKANALLKPLLF